MEVYRKLEQELHAPFVQATTTDLQAGQMIGIQLVLSKLRNGVVLGA
jgi:hypothetical protein